MARKTKIVEVTVSLVPDAVAWLEARAAVDDLGLDVAGTIGYLIGQARRQQDAGHYCDCLECGVIR